MRTARLISLFALPACLSGPDGIARSWPPPLTTLDVAAIAAGDLDGDGAPDLIVVSAGTAAAGAGVYLLRGGADLHPADATPLSSFSAYRALPTVRAPASAQIVSIGGTATALIAYSTGTEVQLTALRGGDLAIAGDHATGLTLAVGDRVWVHTIPFPGNQPHLAIGVGDQLRHVDAAAAVTTGLLNPNQLPPPAGGSWSHPQLADSYTSGSDQIAFVASDTSIDRTAIPTAPPPTGMFTWVRTRSGAAWTGQVTADLDGNGRADVLGFAPAAGGPGQLCASDPSSTGAAPCTPTMLAAADAQVLTATLDATPATDALLVSRGSGATTVAAVLDLAFNGTTLTGTSAGTPLTTAITGGTAALIRTGNVDGVLIVDADGRAICVGATMSGVAACH
jgi:hypothetical protein